MSKPQSLNLKKLTLKIAWMYPDLMSTYGDRGNITVLVKRCQWREIKVEVVEINKESSGKLLKECDLIFMGGAQDRQQKIVEDDLRNNKGPIIKEMINSGTPGLFVCGAYQFLGNYYQPAEGNKIEGLHVFDLYTRHFGKEKARCIGDIVTEMLNGKCPHKNFQEILRGKQMSNQLVGFENHGGRTYLGKNAEALGTVISGFGNNGEDKTEGCIYKNAIGTYLHGPILPKNPHLADWLLANALEKKYNTRVELTKLDDTLEWEAHKNIKYKILKRKNTN